MDHAGLQGVLQSLGHLANVMARIGHPHLAVPYHPSIEADSVHELHDEKVNVARLFGVVGGDDVGMRQPGRRLHFLMEAVQDFGMPAQLAMDDLERDDAVHEPMLGLIDEAHAAGAEELADLIARMVAQFEGQRVGFLGALDGRGAQIPDQRSLGDLVQRLTALLAIGDVRGDGFLIGRFELAPLEGRQLLMTGMFRTHAPNSEDNHGGHGEHGEIQKITNQRGIERKTEQMRN